MPSSDDVLYRLTELERRLSNLCRIGLVDSVDPAAARVRVKIGPVVTGWLPWLTQRAGAAVRVWSPPSVGEQVLVLSPGGETANGIACPAIYRTANSPPSSDADLEKVVFSDGSEISLRRSTGKLTAVIKGDIDVQSDGKVTVVAADGVEITGDLTVSGDITTTTGDVIAGTITLKTHVHADPAGTSAGFVGPPVGP